MSWFQVPEPSLRRDPVIFPAGSRVHSIPKSLSMCFLSPCRWFLASPVLLVDSCSLRLLLEQLRECAPVPRYISCPREILNSFREVMASDSGSVQCFSCSSIIISIR